MIEIRDLRVRKNGSTICAVDELTVESGARVAVVGANGSGKSTLLRVIAGLEKNFEGVRKIARCDRRPIFVHQSPYLFRGTVLYNVKYGLRAAGVRGAAANDRAMIWLGKLGVTDLAHRRVTNLSGGETRRVALARAGALDPALLLLDEPFADLDPAGAEAVHAALADLKTTTIVIASPTPEPRFTQIHLNTPINPSAPRR